jgi:hypothetical protein
VLHITYHIRGKRALGSIERDHVVGRLTDRDRTCVEMRMSMGWSKPLSHISVLYNIGICKSIAVETGGLSLGHMQKKNALSLGGKSLSSVKRERKREGVGRKRRSISYLGQPHFFATTIVRRTYPEPQPHSLLLWLEIRNPSQSQIGTAKADPSSTSKSSCNLRPDRSTNTDIKDCKNFRSYKHYRLLLSRKRIQ